MDDVALIELLTWMIGGVIVIMFSWDLYNQESYYPDRRDEGVINQDLALNFLAPVLPGYAASRTMYIGWFLAFLAFTLSLYIGSFFLSEPEANVREVIERISDTGTISIFFMAYHQLIAALIVTGILSLGFLQYIFINFEKEVFS